jgi:hypothetical protein
MTRFVRVVERGAGWAVVDDTTDQQVRGGFSSREEAERWAMQWGYGGVEYGA